jgi:hypothetical protein
MNDPANYLHEFLAHKGITAEIRRDDTGHTPLILIETEQFYRHRSWIEAWFVLIYESSSYCSFYERPRGTGDTK